jgi:C-terminal processing protease CtpA/Prc
MFFKKIDISKMYGIQWSIPKRLPTESLDTPIDVEIMAVLHGSQAEKDGLKRGQYIKKINDVYIKTRRDIAPFMENMETIKKIEVKNEL